MNLLALAIGIAEFYEPEYGLIAHMSAERDSNPGRTEQLSDLSQRQRGPYRLEGGRPAIAE
jgi:hypothetical protein